MVGVAALRVAIALVLYLSGQTDPALQPPLPLGVYAALAATFGILGLILLTANRYDVRAMWLGGILVLVATPLCSPLFSGRTMWDFGWASFVRADAFLPAFLWRFVSEFPSLLGGRAGRLARVVAHLSAIVGAAIFSLNLSYLIWSAGGAAPDWRLAFTPVPRGGSFYDPIVYGLCAAAFPVLLWRAVQEQGEARRRVLLFAGGLVGGSLPFALQAMLDAIPAYNRFIHQQPVVELLVGVVLFTALGSIPFVTAYSVLFDRIVDLRVVLRTALQYVLARYTILGLTMVPFAAAALLVGRHRTETLAALMTAPRLIVLALMGAAGLVSLKLRRRWLDALDRRYFREQYDSRQVVDGLVSGALAARDASDLEARIHAAIDRTLHANVALFVVNDGFGVLERPGTGGDAISLAAILPSLAVTDLVPMDVDTADPHSPLSRLPPEEKRWVAESGFVLLLGLCASGSRPVGLLALSAKRSGLAYSAEDRRMLSAIGASASLALDNLRLRATSDPASEPPARVCQRCSRMNPSDAKSCTCGGPVGEAAAPHVLRGVFRLDRRIGSGGMGVVYHARDLNLGRSVAIKTLPRVTPERAAQLRREARAMATVAHTNLAVIYDIDTWRGIPFLVQEFLEGGTLALKLTGGPLAIREAIDLAETLAGALDHIHRAGLIHRDVKPSNIGFSAAGVTKLLDFGLARLTRPTDDENGPTTTQTLDADSGPHWSSDGAMVGTLLYMSPEALSREAASPLLDLWSLSVVFYECLTGARPFVAKNATDMLFTITTGTVVPPSALRPECPGVIDEFFVRALHRQSNRRFPDAHSMQDALLRLRASC